MMMGEKDTGSAWVIALGAFVTMFFSNGILRAMGVLLPFLCQQFSTHTWVIGLAIAMIPGFGAFTRPLGGALSKRLSPRFTVMTFSLLFTIGLVAVSLAPSLAILTLALLLSGFAAGTEAVVVGELARYFDKYYDVSIAIAQAGLSVGVMVLPLLTQFFLDVYGWRGAMMLLGGLCFHLVAFGALHNPFTVNTKFESQNNTINTSNVNCGLIQTHGQCLNKIIYYLDLSLFSNIDFVSMVVYNFGNGYCLNGWMIYLVPHGLDVGLHPYKASSLATIGGIGNLLGSFAYPLVKTKISSKQVLYLATVMGSLALAVDTIVSVVPSFVGLLVTSGIFGFGRGMATLSVFKMVRDTVEDDKMTNAVIWLTVADSLGSMLSGFLSGWFFEQTGNYIASFLILSTLCLLSLFPRFILDLKIQIKGKQYSPIPSMDPN